MIRVTCVAASLFVVLFPARLPAAWMGTEQYPGTFEAIKEPSCLNPAFSWNGWTVGEQYRDPNNGLAAFQGTWSMLARWQGNDFVSSPVSYDMGRWTGLHVQNQRGYQPETAAGSPGVQVNCLDSGMLINTWAAPHRPIVGGGYNDMWGYTWPAGSRPRPFWKNNAPTDLILQANVGINLFRPTSPQDNHQAANTSVASAQAAFFAYVRDTAHPDLPPIALLATTHDSRFAHPSNFDTGGVNVWERDGFASFDYSNYDTQTAVSQYPAFFAPGQTGEGVWFTSAVISKSNNNQNPFVSIYYTDGELLSSMAPVDNGGAPPLPFFRAHISAANLVNSVQAIKSKPCPAPRGCPNRVSAYPGGAYSENPADYEVEYAGFIAETTLRNPATDGPDTNYHAGLEDGQWTPNDITKNQVSFGLRAYAFGVYRGIPN